MGLNEDYKDFRCYQLTNDGEYEEIECDLKTVNDLFNSEGVYLMVRFDLRRIFIWKGPKSPVRKRFISSRVGSKIQEESAKIGMHLKIVSVDAGDEPIEFLHAFNVETYEVKEHEKMDDMYYIRNEERRKLEEEQMLQKSKDAVNEKKEYWSPLMEEQKRLEQMHKAKEKAASTAQEIASSLAAPPREVKHEHIKPIPKKEKTVDHGMSSKKNQSLNDDEEQAILDLVLSHDCPKGLKRLNIIIGTSLYSPKKTISSVFGNTVEEIQWAKVEQIPDNNIDIKSNLLRAYCKENYVQALVIFQENGDNNDESIVEEEVETPKKKSSAKKKPLNSIPQG